ncbi:hypothetical protein E4U57_005660 [Claviceps arundinis]|uniref:Uncharacterized protein n=1 Tax=Claviceps arundinis TaxID=1623583 RepID=A0ABQ7PHX4_9HYPO|nr:hypothetical protein E4U57_005660 [Claviceps arundinis]
MTSTTAYSNTHALSSQASEKVEINRSSGVLHQLRAIQEVVSELSALAGSEALHY